MPKIHDKMIDIINDLQEQAYNAGFLDGINSGLDRSSADYPAPDQFQRYPHYKAHYKALFKEGAHV